MSKGHGVKSWGGPLGHPRRHNVLLPVTRVRRPGLGVTCVGDSSAFAPGHASLSSARLSSNKESSFTSTKNHALNFSVDSFECC